MPDANKGDNVSLNPVTFQKAFLNEWTEQARAPSVHHRRTVVICNRLEMWKEFLRIHTPMIQQVAENKQSFIDIHGVDYFYAPLEYYSLRQRCAGQIIEKAIFFCCRPVRDGEEYDFLRARAHGILVIEHHEN